MSKIQNTEKKDKKILANSTLECHSTSIDLPEGIDPDEEPTAWLDAYFGGSSESSDDLIYIGSIENQDTSNCTRQDQVDLNKTEKKKIDSSKSL